MKKWSLLIFCFSLSAFACEIHLPQRILLSTQASGASTKGSRDCETTHLDNFYNVIRHQSGKIPLARIQAALGSSINLKSNESFVTVENIEQLIEDQFPTLKDSQVNWDSGLIGSYIELAPNDKIEIKCHPCDFRGEEIFNLKITDIQTVKHSLDIPSRVFKLEQAIKLKTSVNAFSDNIDDNSWELTNAPSINYGRYFNRPERLKYYKTNKMLRSGDFIKESDLTPLNLVKAGERVEITFENDHVKLKAQAISRQNGGIEDVIEVWNQSNGKKYKGVVTDFNKVTIKL